MAGHLHTKPFINWFSLGFPIVSKSFGIESQYEKSKVVTIVHAPSHKGIKGTELIESVVQELKSEGYNFEYVQLANVPNHEVRSFLAKADIVVDQLWSDTPLAGLACEAASAGCCVIVGGEEWSYFEESLVPIPPSLRVHSSTLKKSLIKCLEEPKFRQRVAKDLQSFARNEWSSKAVAAKYISLFESGNLVGGWVDPSDCIFFGGCGAPKHYFKAIMKRMGANQVGRPNKPS